LSPGAQRIVEFGSLIGDITFDETRVPPPLIVIGDMVGTIGSQHFSRPSEFLITVGVTGDKPAFPSIHVFEGWV
jgi:hypothetical protein